MQNGGKVYGRSVKLRGRREPAEAGNNSAFQTGSPARIFRFFEFSLLAFVLGPLFGERLVARFPLQNSQTSPDRSNRWLPETFCDLELVRLGCLAHDRIIVRAPCPKKQ